MTKRSQLIEFLEANRRSLLRRASAYIGREYAEDLVQGAALNAWRYIDQWSGEGMAAWFGSILYHESVSMFRNRVKDHRAKQLLEDTRTVSPNQIDAVMLREAEDLSRSMSRPYRMTFQILKNRTGQTAKDSSTLRGATLRLRNRFKVVGFVA